MSRELELKDLLTAAILPERRAAVERAMADISVAEANLDIARANLHTERVMAERLQADNARLRAALFVGVEALEWYEQQQVSDWDLGQKASLILKAALAGKDC